MQHIIEFRCSACLAIHWFDAILGNSEKNQPCLRSDQDSFRSTKPTMLLMIRESLVGWLIYPVEIRYCANLSHDATDENQKKLAGMKIPLMTYNPTYWQKKTQEKPRKSSRACCTFLHNIFFFGKIQGAKTFTSLSALRIIKASEIPVMTGPAQGTEARTVPDPRPRSSGDRMVPPNEKTAMKTSAQFGWARGGKTTPILLTGTKTKHGY